MEFENLNVKSSTLSTPRRTRAPFTPEEILNIEKKGYISRYSFFDVKRSWQNRYKTEIFEKKDIIEVIDDLPVGTKIKLKDQKWYIKHKAIKLIYNNCDTFLKNNKPYVHENYIIYEKIDPIIITI